MGNVCITPTTIMAADVPINFLIFEFPDLQHLAIEQETNAMT